MMQKPSRLFFWLLGIYVIFFLVLAVNPVDQMTWLMENLIILAIVATIFFLYLRGIYFSKLAYLLMFIPLYIYTIGGHYTFPLVPFDFVTELFGFTRNNFDRVGHFSVGFYAFPIAEWLHSRRLVVNRWLLFTYPIFLIATIGMAYEIIEWVFVIISKPQFWQTYLGAQGDIWDAQKDMLADSMGAICLTIIFFISRRKIIRKM